jgi:hypothetical protein
MALPITGRLRVDEAKIVGYLLNHSNSQGKAAFFLLGFRAEAWAELANALKQLARSNSVVAAVDSPYGTRYSVDGELQSPSGKRPRVRSVWIREGDADEVRLITAYPVKEKP